MSHWEAHKALVDSSKSMVILVIKFSGSQNNNHQNNNKNHEFRKEPWKEEKK